MNLLFLVDLQKRFFGGGVYSVYKFGESLAKRGHTIHMFWLGKHKFYGDEEIPNFNISRRFTLASHMRGSIRLDNLVEKIYDLLYLNSFMKKYGESIDYVIGIQIKTALKTVKVGNKYNKKVANFIFEAPEWLRLKMGEKWFTSGLQKLWDRFKDSLEKSTIIFPNSWSTKKYAEQWLEREIAEPIFPGIEMTGSVQNLPLKRNQIIYIGRLREHKNVNEIIEALSEIPLPPQLLVCGSGPEEKNLKNLAKKLGIHCEFRGHVCDEDKWRFISESRFMVFPTSFEGFGMPPMEALAQGVPCICSDIPILREVYEDKVEYFAEHNVPQLAKQIQFLLDNPDYSKKRGEEGKKFVAEKFSWEKSAQKIEEILSLILTKEGVNLKSSAI